MLIQSAYSLMAGALIDRWQLRKLGDTLWYSRKGTELYEQSMDGMDIFMEEDVHGWPMASI
jgi:hypothetical protein